MWDDSHLGYSNERTFPPLLLGQNEANGQASEGGLRAGEGLVAVGATPERRMPRECGLPLPMGTATCQRRKEFCSEGGVGNFLHEVYPPGFCI